MDQLIQMEYGVVFKLGLYCFNIRFLTGVVLVFQRGEVLFKSGVELTPKIRWDTAQDCLTSYS